MSEILNINDFAQAGLNTDLPPHDLGPGFLTDMNNMRVVNRSIQSFGGYRTWGVPVEFNPGWLIHAGSLTGEFWLIAGESAVESWDGSNFIDISSATGYGDISDKSLWTGDIFANFIVATHPQIYPEYWVGINAADPMLPLPFDDSNTFEDKDIRVGILRAHKDFLIALELVELGVEEIDTVRWSDAAAVGNIPASWDEFDVNTLAGKAPLGGPGGKIIDGRPLRDAFCIYRENGVTMMDATNDIFVWRFRHLETTSGLINKDCCVQVKQHHFYLSDGDIVKNDGNEVVSIMHQRIRERFINRINVESFFNSYALKNDVAKEIWFCVPEDDALFPSTAYIYNWRDDTWFIRDLNPEVIFMAYGPELARETRTWNNWAETWDTATGAWGSDFKTPLNNSLVGIIKPDSGSELIIIEGDDDDNVEDYISFIKRTGFPLEGHDNVTTIQSLYPHMEGTVDVRVRVGSQRHANAPIEWKPYVIFNPAKDRRVNIRTTGELHAFRFESDSDSGKWSISGMDIEYARSGKR